MENTIKGLHYKTNLPLEIKLKDGFIDEVKNNLEKTSTKIIATGLVDLQVNGFRGIDFNEQGLQEADVVKLTSYLWEEGVTGYYPTLITNSIKNINKAISVIVNACKNNDSINKSIKGIHLEGPFLSVENGPRGAHPLEHIKAPNWDLVCEWQKLAEGRIKMITIAPEWPNSTTFIKQCVDAGIIVSIGHTSATPEQIEQAVLAGARNATHLGNASHLMLPRHSNYVWEQLASEKLWATIIADGFHLPKSMLKIFLKVKEDKCVLVSDATRFAGLAAGSYNSHIGGVIELNKEGRLFIKDNPKMLAGSAQSLRWCIDHLVNSKISSLSTAIDMASINARKLIGEKNVKELELGAVANLIVFERVDHEIKIVKTIVNGKEVFSKE